MSLIRKFSGICITLSIVSKLFCCSVVRSDGGTTQTPVAKFGAYPTNQEWSFPRGFCAVPVFPATSANDKPARQPVPPLTTARRLCLNIFRFLGFRASDLIFTASAMSVLIG